MKGKSLYYMTVVAVALCGIALYVTKSGKQEPPKNIGSKVFADLAVNDIDTITVTAKDGTATLTRSGDTWISKDRNGYPANFDKLKNALIRLADTKITQSMQVSKNQLDSMKLNDPSSEKSNPANSATVVTLSGSGRKIASFMIGAAHLRKGDQPGIPAGMSYPDGAYISLDDGKTAYLVKNTMDEFSANATEWLDKELFSIQGPDIEEITVRTPSNETVRMLRKEGSLRVEGLQQIEEENSSKISSLEGAFGYMRCDDIAGTKLNDADTGLDNPYIVTLVTKDRERYTAKISSKSTPNEARYVRFEFALLDPEKEKTEPQPAVTTDAASSTNAPALTVKTDEQKKAEAAEKAEKRKQQEEKIKALNEKFAKWTFILERYRTDSLTVNRSELISRKIIKDDSQEKKTIGPDGSTQVSPENK